jgi:hypothetical protein
LQVEKHVRDLEMVKGGCKEEEEAGASALLQ